MLQHILVPLDGSDLAERALAPAAQLARATGALLYLARVIPPPAVLGLDEAGYLAAGAYDDLVQAETREVESYLQAVRDRLNAQGIVAHTAQLHGEVGSALLDYERAADIDLVIICTHGRGGIARIAFGSVAEHLLRHGTTPLLLVHSSSTPVTLEHAVVPLDGSIEHEEVLRLVVTLTPAVVQRVSLLRVVTRADQEPDAQRYLAAIAQRLEQQDVRVVERRVAMGDHVAAIRAMSRDGQLVVMATRARSQLTRWFDRSVAEQEVHDPEATLLLIRTREAQWDLAGSAGGFTGAT